MNAHSGPRGIRGGAPGGGASSVQGVGASARGPSVIGAPGRSGRRAAGRTRGRRAARIASGSGWSRRCGWSSAPGSAARGVARSKDEDGGAALAREALAVLRDAGAPLARRGARLQRGEAPVVVERPVAGDDPDLVVLHAAGRETLDLATAPHALAERPDAACRAWPPSGSVARIRSTRSVSWSVGRTSGSAASGKVLRPAGGGARRRRRRPPATARAAAVPSSGRRQVQFCDVRAGGVLASSRSRRSAARVTARSRSGGRASSVVLQPGSEERRVG